MNACTMVEGNLAVASSYERPRFHVVDGGLDARPAPRPAPRPVAVQPCSTVSPRTVLVASACVLAVLAALFGGLASRQAAFDAALASQSRIEVAVERGDTLWSIASAHPIDGMSQVDTVEVLKSWNGLEQASLQPGMVLSVPA